MPNFDAERVNGVAVSDDPLYGTDDTYYVNAQAGEELVTNPSSRALPEELLLGAGADFEVAVVSRSNLVADGARVLSDAHARTLRAALRDDPRRRFADAVRHRLRRRVLDGNRVQGHRGRPVRHQAGTAVGVLSLPRTAMPCLAACALAAGGPGHAQPADAAVSFSVGADDRVRIELPSAADRYHVLYYRSTPEDATTEYAVAIQRGAEGSVVLSEPLRVGLGGAYRVETYLNAAPGDADGDGRDDLAELDRAEAGARAPLNPGGADWDRARRPWPSRIWPRSRQLSYQRRVGNGLSTRTCERDLEYVKFHGVQRIGSADADRLLP